MTALDSYFSNEAKNIIEKFLIDQEIITVIPNENNWHCFIGGSRRFGYYIENSDLDLFYYTTMIPNKYREILIFNGFKENVPYVNFEGCSTGWKHPKYNIHIVLIGQVDYFNKVANDHIKVENFIKCNPQIIPFIQNLKVQRVKLKGSVIYKTLLRMTQLQGY